MNYCPSPSLQWVYITASLSLWLCQGCWVRLRASAQTLLCKIVHTKSQRCWGGPAACPQDMIATADLQCIARVDASYLDLTGGEGKWQMLQLAPVTWRLTMHKRKQNQHNRTI